MLEVRYFVRYSCSRYLGVAEDQTGIGIWVVTGVIDLDLLFPKRDYLE